MGRVFETHHAASWVRRAGSSLRDPPPYPVGLEDSTHPTSLWFDPSPLVLLMLDVPAIRRQFPALQRVVGGQSPVFLDGPGGTQVPRRVIDAIAGYLSTCNANHGGVFTTSRESDAILHEAHQAAADLLNAPSPREIVFGQNMTSLTFHVSRSIARTLKPGDIVVVTRLDHDANVRPWVLAARDAGAEVRFVDVRPEDGTLDLDDLARCLQGRVRLLAVSCASNAVGTMPEVGKITRQAHAAGGAGLPRRGTLRSAWRHRRAGVGLRLPGLLGVQVLRPACGNPLGEKQLAGSAAGVQGSSVSRHDS